MKKLLLSAHSLDLAACPRRYWYYRVAGRAPAVVSPALAQGIAGHGALARWRQGKSQAEQDAFIDSVFAVHPPPLDDFRTPYYLREALVQYKAEHQEDTRWQWEEVEQEFEELLGRWGDTEIWWTGRRDAVGIFKPDGRRYVFDNKFVSRDESAEARAAQNSRALKGYCWSWGQRHPDRPVAGVIQRRVVIRPPTKAKAFNITFPLDPPIFFAPAVLDEWRVNTLSLAAQILSRNDQPLAWPMEESLCRRTWGCCDYIDVCTLPLGDRPVKLASDAFKPTGERFSYDTQEAE